jgi:hypothetical protein
MRSVLWERQQAAAFVLKNISDSHAQASVRIQEFVRKLVFT